MKYSSVVFLLKKFLSSLRWGGGKGVPLRSERNIRGITTSWKRKQDQAGRVIPVLTHVSVIWSVINARNQLVSHRSYIHHRSGRGRKSLPFPLMACLARYLCSHPLVYRRSPTRTIPFRSFITRIADLLGL